MDDSSEEADYGCEERLPGEPRMLLITLESEDGAEIRGCRVYSCGIAVIPLPLFILQSSVKAP